MKLKKILYLSITAVTALSFGLGCLGGDESLSKSTGMSKRGGGIKPTVNSVSVPANLPNYSNNLNSLPPDPDTWFIDITFTREINPSTINTNTVYVNEAEAAGAVKPRVTAQSVQWIAGLRTARLQWTSASIEIELVVTTGVQDITGEGLCGLAYWWTAYPITNISSEYRRNVGRAGSVWNPNYRPEIITIAAAVTGATTVDILSSSGWNAILATTVTAANFELIPAVSAAPTLVGDINAGLTLSYTGLVENTEYQVTFNPDGVAMDKTLATRTYPDGTTPLPILGGQDIINSYLNGGAVQTSDYEAVFKTQTTGTEPTVTAITREGVNKGYPIALDYALVQINYLIEMDPVSVINPDNYIVSDDPTVDDDPGPGILWGVGILQVEITPYYETGDTFLHRVLISTLNYSQEDINLIVIKDGVKSATGLHLEVNGDNIQSNGADYDLNGTPDDWTAPLAVP